MLKTCLEQSSLNLHFQLSKIDRIFAVIKNKNFQIKDYAIINMTNPDRNIHKIKVQTLYKKIFQKFYKNIIVNRFYK